MLATGASLIGSAQFAGAAPERRGGVFKVGTIGASVEVDPQVAYITTSWWMQYATAAKLYNYRPGGKLVPEVASSFRVSNSGKRYTFTLRKGFRFSDGSAVTGANFKYAIDRSANKDLAAPAAQFIIDPQGTEIVGAKDVNEGRAASVRGVQVRGKRLIINLTRPDAQFVSKLTLPFFQATSTRLRPAREVVTVRSMADLPSAGPYAFTWNEVNRLTQLRRNPYWKPGPGRTAPRNLDGVDVLWNQNEQAAYELVEQGELDEGPIPAGEIEGVAGRYGINRARFWSKASPCVEYIAFNNSNPLLRGNAAMRKAISWALDRTDYVAPFRAFSTMPWTHLLPPGFPGSITKKRLQPYSPRANIAKARELAEGHFRDGSITVAYRSSGTIHPAQAELVKRDLINLGFDPPQITMRGFSGGQIYTAMGTRGTDLDLAVSLSSCHAYGGLVNLFPPFGFFFEDQTYLQRYLRRIAAANRLEGKARFKALGRLDLEIMRNVAPLAVMNAFNDLYFFSSRVDPRSLSFHRVYTGWSIPSAALK
jgi:peptide/nickel transport system substrate-binding protein